MTSMKRLRALAGVAVACAALAAAGGLTAREKLGKQIYLRGINAAGKEITAYLGNPAMEVPGSLMVCANCHGFDGRGNPEGGVTPSDITWQALTKPYGVTHESGRRHPAYTAVLMERAIVQGLDPAGNKLSPAMPTYKMPAEDLSDLIAYLKRVADDVDPGLTDDTITLGTLVPRKGQLAGVGEGLRAVLAAFFDDLNAQGGIYSRKIELRVAECGQSVAETKEKVGRFVEEQEVFALVGAFIAGADKELASLLEEKEVPLVGPSTLYPHIGYPLNRRVFYLFSGVKEESRALAAFAAQNLQATGARATVLYPEDASGTEVAAAVDGQCRKSGWAQVTQVPYVRSRFDPKNLVRQLSGAGTNVVFFLGSGREEMALAEEAGKLGWKPSVLLPSSQAGREILETSAAFQGKIYMSFPMRTSDQAPEAVAEYRAFAGKHKIPDGHLAVALSAYSAAKVLVEGLKKAGRNVSREKLIVALEGMYKFTTGLTPPITYGANRRIGAMGAYVVEVQLAKKNLVPVSGWIEVE